MVLDILTATLTLGTTTANGSHEMPFHVRDEYSADHSAHQRCDSLSPHDVRAPTVNDVCASLIQEHLDIRAEDR